MDLPLAFPEDLDVINAKMHTTDEESVRRAVRLTAELIEHYDNGGQIILQPPGLWGKLFHCEKLKFL